MDKCRANLLSIYRSALSAVNGRQCTVDWLRRQRENDFRHVIAIGKAAAAMATGALDVLGDSLETVLIITRQGYTDPGLARDRRIRQYASGHPVPDQRSLDAGRMLLDFLATSDSQAPILFLISGGASALAEVLPARISLADLQRANAWLLGSGLEIQAMNAVRGALSKIKGGRLTAYLSDRPATVLLLSDVPDDDPAIIGSGLLFCPGTSRLIHLLPDWLQMLLQQAGNVDDQFLHTTKIPHHIIADARMARRAACRQAQLCGYQVMEHDQLITGDVYTAAASLAGIVAESPPGLLHVWSGETTVVLPERPGIGGRCQALALAVAVAQTTLPSANAWSFLAGGSDGSDGPGMIAGALVDNESLTRIQAAGLEAQHCLTAADAGTCLDAASDLLLTGPTGTNVMDLMLGLRA